MYVLVLIQFRECESFMESTQNLRISNFKIVLSSDYNDYLNDILKHEK